MDRCLINDYTRLKMGIKIENQYVMINLEKMSEGEGIADIHS